MRLFVSSEIVMILLLIGAAPKRGGRASFCTDCVQHKNG